VSDVGWLKLSMLNDTACRKTKISWAAKEQPDRQAAAGMPNSSRTAKEQPDRQGAAGPPRSSRTTRSSRTCQGAEGPPRGSQTMGQQPGRQGAAERSAACNTSLLNSS